MTILRVDHTGIAVRDLDEAVERFSRLFGLKVEQRAVVAEQGVEVAFLRAGDTQIELICPVSRESGVARFLDRFGERLHHVGLLVDDLEGELDRLRREGIQLIDRNPRTGVHGRIAFIHPHGTGGTLVELVEHEENSGSMPS